MKKIISFLLLVVMLTAVGTPAALAYETLKPGSTGQEVLDARMRLYELGYFTKVPTQTNYTNSMMDYVEKFEKDYGLKVDGILSPEDQEVLFGKPSTPPVTVEPIILAENAQIDGIFVNEGYVDKDRKSMTEILVCYTFTAGSKGIGVNGNKSVLAFSSGNTYRASHRLNSCISFGNYYSGSNYESAVFGDKLHIVDTFVVPKAELTFGGTITLTNTSASALVGEVKLTAEQFVSCKNVEEIAKIVDPEGYKERKHALTEANNTVKNKVRKQLNGYYWDFYTNNLSYRISFNNNGKYTLTTSIGIKTSGKYTICNGFIILKNDSTGALSYAPYTFENNHFDLDIHDGFDVSETP
nr:peptidoglycan-binding protein [Clostridia bacterium]